MVRWIPMLAALALAGCATAEAPKVAVCDGKHRRPANPYGSVLPEAPLDEARPANTPPLGAPGAPPATDKPAPAPRPVSMIDPRSLRPCGRSA